MKVSKRSCSRVVESEWLDYLYDEVIIYYENDDVDFSVYYQNKNPFLQSLQQKIGFKLKDKLDDIGDDELNTFYFTDTENSKVKSFFSHLRNSISHNRIFKSQNSDELRLEDASPLSKKKLKDGEIPEMSMYARIESFEKLKQIIKGVKSYG